MRLSSIWHLGASDRILNSFSVTVVVTAERHGLQFYSESLVSCSLSSERFTLPAPLRCSTAPNSWAFVGNANGGGSIQFVIPGPCGQGSVPVTPPTAKSKATIPHRVKRRR